MVRWLNSMIPHLLYFCTPRPTVLTFPCIAKLLHFHSVCQVRFIKAMQICYCHIMLRFLSCYCHFLLFLAVLVGTDHNWSHGFQWMPQAVHLTYSICFPCTGGRFGKGGLVNHLQPTTDRIGLLQRRKENGECRKPEDLDHALMGHLLGYHSKLGLIFGGAAPRSPHRGVGNTKA